VRCQKHLWESQRKRFIDYVYEKACESATPIPEIEPAMNLIQITLYVLKDELKSEPTPRLKYKKLYSLVESVELNFKNNPVRAINQNVK